MTRSEMTKLSRVVYQGQTPTTGLPEVQWDAYFQNQAQRNDKCPVCKVLGGPHGIGCI